MATTTKTLTPTNQTITLPDMTERPNASVLVDGIGKEADAIEAAVEKVLDLGYRTDDIMQAGKTRVTCEKMGALVKENI